MKKKALITKGNLTKREKLLLYRLRLGQTQAQFSKKVKLTHDQYKRIERGAIGSVKFLRKIQVSIDSLTPQEMCIVMRRRSGMTQAEIAKGCNRSRYRVIQMENGDASVVSLYDFWRERKSN